MRTVLGLLMLVVPAIGLAAEPSTQRRCGWVDNPTPANWELTDRDGAWTVSAQGGHHAAGDLPEFPETTDYWVTANGSYGYGCGCFDVAVDSARKLILAIHRSRVLPLKRCQADRSLPARRA